MHKVGTQGAQGGEVRTGQIAILMMMLFFNFISRGIFAPLLPVFEEQFGVDHGRASSLFLIISLSMSTCMVFSGYISKHLTHRGTIVLYEFMLGLSLILCALSPSFLFLQFAAAFLGASAGLYAPSGLATVTNLTREEHWGKALGIHDLGPSLGLISAPLVVGLALPSVNWELLFFLIAAGNWVNGIFYAFKGRGGELRGSPPHFKNLKLIFENRNFLILTLFFMLAASSAVGVYSILPTYLITSKGFDSGLVNTLVGLSRVSGLVLIFTAGYLVDKFGIRLFIGLILAGSGLFAAALGILESTPLLFAVFFQPTIISAFFPVVNTAISSITRPETRSVAFSMVLPLAAAVGSGLTPMFMGFLGERGHFPLGFLALGAVTLLSLLFLPFLRAEKKRDIKST